MTRHLQWPDNVKPPKASPELRQSFSVLCRELALPTSYDQSLEQLYLPMAQWLVDIKHHLGLPTLCFGVNGGQGAGKSTLCRFLQLVLQQAFAQRTAGLSIDDIYLTQAERKQLGADVHPLLETRGVPGTHDPQMGIDIIHQLRALRPDESMMLPQFDKSTDDRAPENSWPKITGPVDVIIFEGWCIGTPAQTEESLLQPFNTLEAEDDPTGQWRHYVNQQLQNQYHRLFNQLDCLLLLQVPGLAQVKHWRSQQEQQLERQRPGGTGVMTESALERFLMHYQRLTKHSLDVLPELADISIQLGADHQFEQVTVRSFTEEELL